MTSLNHHLAKALQAERLESAGRARAGRAQRPPTASRRLRMLADVLAPYARAALDPRRD